MKKIFKINLIEFFLIIGFVISAFSFSIIISSTYRYYKTVVEKNTFNNDYKSLSLNLNTEQLNLASFFNWLNKQGFHNSCTPMFATNIEVGDIFINNNIMGVSSGFNMNKYSTIEGRYFTENELNTNSKVAIIGDGLKKYTQKDKGIEYIKVFEEYYQVIGIINNSSYFKFVSLVPLNSLYFVNNKYTSFRQLVSKDYVNKETPLKFDNASIEIKDIPTDSIISYLFQQVPSLKESLYSLCLGIINLLLFSYFFANGIKREISIMKVLGANNTHIFKEILSKLFIVSTLGIILGLILSYFTITLMNKGFPNSYGNLDFYNIAITSFLVYITTIISSFIILLNVIKFKILKEIR